jgi:ribonucleotide reductase alpha subunit
MIYTQYCYDVLQTMYVTILQIELNCGMLYIYKYYECNLSFLNDP